MPISFHTLAYIELNPVRTALCATSATNPAVVGEVSVRALALSIAGQDPGKLIEVKPFLITQDELNKNDIRTNPGPGCQVARLWTQRSGNRAMAAGHPDAVTVYLASLALLWKAFA